MFCMYLYGSWEEFLGGVGEGKESDGVGMI